MAKTSKKQTQKRVTRQRSKGKQTPDLIDTIPNFINLCAKFEMQLVEYRRNWKVVIEDCLVFYKMDTSKHLRIVMSIKIEKTLRVRAFMEHGEADKKYLDFLLNEEHLLQTWSQLKNILQYFSSENIDCKRSLKQSLSLASFHLKECLEKCSMEEEKSGLKSKLEFIYGQIYALTEGRFTDKVLSLAYTIYVQSSFCYRCLEGLKSLTLPKKKDLVAYAASID